jgi:hypothetical protein
VMHVSQDRGCDWPHPCSLVVAVGLNFGSNNALNVDVDPPHLIPTVPSQPHAPLNRYTTQRGTMASNKKSGLTGYLPDILMAAAAVRVPVPSHSDFILTRIQPLIAYFVIRNLLARLDPEAQQKEEARAKASAANRKLDAILTGKRRKSRERGEHDSDDEFERLSLRPRIADLNLNTYEQTIAMEVVAPEEIPISFEGMSKKPYRIRDARKFSILTAC